MFRVYVSSICFEYMFRVFFFDLHFKKMEIIHEAVIVGRFVVFNEKNSGKLYKIARPRNSEDDSDCELIENLKKHFAMEQINKHFEFWENITNKEQENSLKDFIDQINDFKIGLMSGFKKHNYKVFETQNRGIDMSKLYLIDDCNHGEFQNKPCLGFQPTLKYWKNFLLHIIKSLEMLSVIGVVHNDLFMRNIIVDNFESELKITNPILIDFGESITSQEAEKENARDFWFFFKDLLLWKSSQSFYFCRNEISIEKISGFTRGEELG